MGLNDKIRVALKEIAAQLADDPENTSAFTGNGMPKVEVIRNLVDDETITRQQITDAAPAFTKDNLEVPELEGDDETEEPQETGDDNETEEQETSSGWETSDNPLGDKFPSPDFMPFDLSAVQNPIQFVEDEIKNLPKEEIEEVMASLEKEHGFFRDLSKNAKDRQDKIGDLMNAVHTYYGKLFPEPSLSETVTTHLAKSQARRVAEVNKTEALFGGLKINQLADLDPRATIDKAMQRDTRRGKNRPNMPINTPIEGGPSGV